MWEDPIVEEVRRARLEIEQECDNDFRKIYERAVEVQKKVTEQRISDKKRAKEQEPLAV